MHPGVIGVGLDENTCAIVEDDRIITVLGMNAITIVDGKEVAGTTVAKVMGSRPVAVSGLKIYVLTEGCSFDLKAREARIPGVRLE